MNDDTPDRCPSCDREHEPSCPVTWDPVSGWLCQNCRSTRTDAELGATRQANAAAAQMARATETTGRTT